MLEIIQGIWPVLVIIVLIAIALLLPERKQK